MAKGKKTMEIDSSDGSTFHAQSSAENNLVAIPVAGGSSGEGLPYAPVNWPCLGDVWRWKVGNRRSVSGHWVDRYIYPPSRLHVTSGGKSGGFQSRLSLEEYLRKEFPGADIDAFFASFIWRITATDHTPNAEKNSYIYTYPKSLNANGCSRTESAIGPGDCKAGNMMCSLRVKGRSYAVAAKTCDICCSETGFCRDCCCILCCKSIDWAYGGYSFIRCEAAVDEKFICGHVAHMDCALRAYMAGTVGGSIDLDAQYYCRRCDNKTDLIPHVNKLIKNCESLDCRVDIEKILNMGFCILRGSKQERAKSLRNRIALILAKLKHGVHLDEIWREENSIPRHAAGDTLHLGNEVTVLGTPEKRGTQEKRKHKITTVGFAKEVDPSGIHLVDGIAQRPMYITCDGTNLSVKLENEIDQALQELKSSQELEYSLAEQKLYAQKDLLLGLYRQLEAERSELEGLTPPLPKVDCGDALTNVLNRVNQIKEEEAKLQQIMSIAKGFGQTTKSVLTEHFGIIIDD